MMAAVVIAVILTGALLTTKAMITEEIAWRRPLVLALGMLLSLLAVIGVIATEVCK